MTKVILISVLTSSLALAVACERRDDTGTSSTRTTSASDQGRGTQAQPQPQQQPTMRTPSENAPSPEVTGGMPGKTVEDKPTEGKPSAALSSDDKEFMTKAAKGSMLEVALGREIQRKAASPDVKVFGKRMVDDHGKASRELHDLAAKKGVMLPTTLDKDHKDEVDKLAKLSGPKLDKEYADEMVDEHEKDVKEFRDATKDVKDPELRAWAEKTLPVLESHLTMAKDLKEKEKKIKQ